jgi:hypothetical protein
MSDPGGSGVPQDPGVSEPVPPPGHRGRQYGTGRDVLAWFRRHPVLTASLVLVALIRVAVPIVLARVLSTEASRALGARVAIGDVDLGLLRGTIALEDVAVFALPPETDGATLPTRDQALVTWDAFAVNLRWLDLPFGTVGFSHVLLDGPVVRVERAQDESIDLVKVFAPATGGDDEEEADLEASPWRFFLESGELRDGRIVFRDRAVAAAPLSIELDDAELQGFVWPLEGAEGASDFGLEVRSQGGTLALSGTIGDAGDGGPKIHAEIQADALPLVTGAAYVRDLGWSGLRGHLDIDGTYARAGDHHQIKGAVTLRDATIDVRDRERSPLRLEHLSVTGIHVDLASGNVRLGDVALEGASLTADPREPFVLPILKEILAEEGDTGSAGETGAADDTPSDGSGDAVADEPWSWSVRKIVVDESVVYVPSQPEGLELAVELGLDDLQSNPGTISDLRGKVVGAGGQLTIDGKLRTEPPGIRAELAWDDLQIGRLLSVVPDSGGRLVRSGTASGRLTMWAGMGESGRDADAGAETVNDRSLHVQGRAGVSGLEVAGADAETFEARFSELSVGVRRLVVPAVLPGGSDGEASSTDPVIVHLDTVALNDPVVRMTLDASGLVLPGEPQVGIPAEDADGAGETGAPPEDEASAAPASEENVAPKPDTGGADTKKGAATPEAPSERGPAIDRAAARTDAEEPTGRAEPAAGAPVSDTVDGTEGDTPRSAENGSTPTPAEPSELLVRIDTLSVEKLRSTLVDRTYEKPLTFILSGERLTAKNVVWPDLALTDLAGNGRLMKSGKWKIEGHYHPSKADVRLDVDKFPLLSVAPAIRRASGYKVTRGDLSLGSRLETKGGEYSTDNAITLHQFRMSEAASDEADFEESFGVSLSLALMLLRDPGGNISLSLPVSGNVDRIETGFRTALASALRQAIIGAVTSPLKLVGAVALRGGKVEGIKLDPIEFVSGRDAVAKDGLEQLEALAQLLVPRPAMGVSLSGFVTTKDVGILKRDKLTARLGGSDDLPGIGFLQRRRLHKHAEALARRESSELGDEDAAAFERLLADTVVEQAELTALATRRAERVASLLVTEFEARPEQARVLQPQPTKVSTKRGGGRVAYEIVALE